MKVSQDNLAPPPPTFTPVRVTIDLETLEEAKALKHLCGCWNTLRTLSKQSRPAPFCSEEEEVYKLAYKLFSDLNLPV